MVHSSNNIPGSGLTLGSNHSSPFDDAANRFAQIRATTNEWNRKIVFRNVIKRVSGCEDFRFINHVNAQCFENSSFFIVSNTSLGHDRDTGGFDDSLNEIRVTHASNTSICTDVCGYALESHYTRCTRIFCNMGLLRCNNVHNDAAFLHFSKSTLEQLSALSHLIQID